MNIAKSQDPIIAATCSTSEEQVEIPGPVFKLEWCTGGSGIKAPNNTPEKRYSLDSAECLDATGSMKAPEVTPMEQCRDSAYYPEAVASPRYNSIHGIHLGKLVFLAKSVDGYYNIRQYKDTETSLVPTRKGVCMDKSQWKKLRDVKSKLPLGGSLYLSPSVYKGETSMHIREFQMINNKLVQQLYGITLSADQWKLLLKSRKLA